MQAGPQIEFLYSAIPDFDCKPGCFECCGPVPLHPWESERIGVEDSATITVEELKSIKKAFCQFLKNGKCSIYDHRPLMCRLYGTVENLRCPYGKRPETLLTKKQADKLMKEYIGLFPTREG